MTNDAERYKARHTPSTQAQRDEWYKEGYKRGCKAGYDYASKYPGMPGFFGIEADEIHRTGYLKGYDGYQLFRFGKIPCLEF